MNRRSFLRGLMATTAAGLLIPERKVWALDQTMIRIPSERVTGFIIDEAAYLPNLEWGFSPISYGDIPFGPDYHVSAVIPITPEMIEGWWSNADRM